MTVVAAFLCSDGMVAAADSMLTPSFDNLNIGHHTGVKVYVLPGPQVFAFAGDQGQAGRFKLIAESNAAQAGGMAHPLLYGLSLSQATIQQFQSTGIGLTNVGVNAILGFLNGGGSQCCVLEGAMHPRCLDQNHYYVALGSGKLSADPFLRFLTDIFCQRGQPPKVSLATFLAIWTVQHVIDVNPGGVAGPIRVAIIERDSAGGYSARELPQAEIDLHVQATDDAAGALRAWSQAIQGGQPLGSAPPPPTPPRAPPQPARVGV